jgi:ABC-type phosphate/phosphonate transport system substrate-binding protein
MTVAILPMYNLPEIKPALDAFWHGLRGHLSREGIRGLSAKLPHDRPLKKLWRSPNMLLTQCCGMDLVKRYAGKIVPLATPRYGAPGCRGAEYASVVVVAETVRAEDVLEMRNSICVVNGLESHSGTNSLRILVAPQSQDGRFFSEIKVSGGLLLSLEMLRAGRADVAAIDCVTYAMIESYRPRALDGTRRIGWTYRAPAIPYVTRQAVDGETCNRLRAGIFKAFEDPARADVRRLLYLKGIEPFRRMPTPPSPRPRSPRTDTVTTRWDNW